MPYTAGNPKLFYQTEGDGPLVILLHGLLMEGNCWAENGLVQMLSDNFCVVYPDLLGHGLSEKPSEYEDYAIDRQVDLIVELINSLGYKRAHIISYSSGSWLALGLAQRYPEYLVSLAIGGWDCVDGLPDISGEKLTFDMFMDFAKQTAPELVSSIDLESENALRCFFNTLREQLPMREVLRMLLVPVSFWAGMDDPYHSSLNHLANEYNLPFISGAGDHVSALSNLNDSVAERINRSLFYPENE